MSSSHRQGLRVSTCLSRILLALGMVACALPAWANPEGGVVVGGSASVSASDKTVTVNQQSDRAILNWQKFNIETDETTRFVQPSAEAIALNRVMDRDPSKIMGTLSANGKIILVNPNGVFFGKDSVVDVGGIIASTADIADDKFMEGQMVFDKAGTNNAAIINQGTITAREAGLVGFVAPNVVNQGTITAKLGRVHLATGDTATVDLYGDGLMEVAVSDEVTSQMLLNSGIIDAGGGTIELSAAAGAKIVNSLIVNSGVIAAQSEGEKTGSITIQAEGSNGTDKTGDSVLINTGVIDASGRDKGERGGTITVTGDKVGLMDGALLDASGDAGYANTTQGKEISAKREGAAGGDIRVGGDYLGQGEMPRAKDLYVDAGALILNDAITSGDAGRSIFWSDGTTDFYGNVYARALGGKAPDSLTGHAQQVGLPPEASGVGGFVETSGHGQLNAGGYVDLTSSTGDKGTYFLDPTNIAIYGNVDPAFVSTDATINLSTALKLWLDAADATKVTLTYNSLGTTASGASGATTITVSANTNLVVGARIRLGAAGAVTTADTVGADTYTIASIDGTTITLTSALTQDYAGSGIYQGYVSSWADKSGLGNNVVQATAGNMPLYIANGINNLGQLKFNGSTTALKNTTFLNGYTGVLTAFAEMEIGGTGFHFLGNRSGSGGYGLFGTPGGSTAARFTTFTIKDYDSATGYWVVSAPTIASVTFNSSYSTTFQKNGLTYAAINNGAGASSSVAAFAVGYSGTTGYYNGIAGETFLYTSVLPSASLDLLNQYQSAKWGVALTPPGTGATEVAKATAADGYSVFTSRYLERLSETANVSLQATNDITLDLKGDTINFATAGRSLSLTAGNVISTLSAGGITTNNAAIGFNATNGILLNHGFTLSSGGGAINLTTSNAPITWTTDSLSGVTNGSINAGTGTVTLKPATASTTIGINGGAGTLGVTSSVLGMIGSAAKVVIGDSAAGTGLTTINGGDLRGKTYDVEVYGGAVTLSGSNILWNGNNDIKLEARTGALTLTTGLTKSGGAESQVVLNGATLVSMAGAISAASGSPFDLWATSDGRITSWSNMRTWGGDAIFRSNAHDVAVTSLDNAAFRTWGGSITTDGGDIIIGGGSASDGNGRPTGYAESSGYYGVQLRGGTILQAGGGDISMLGKTTYAASHTEGLNLMSVTVGTTGAGNLTIDGIATGNYFGNIIEGTTTLATEDGTMTIGGTSMGSNIGLYLYTGATLNFSSTTGDLIFLGRSNSGTGLYSNAASTKIFSTSGDITLTGNNITSGTDFSLPGTTYIGTNNAGITTSGVVTLRTLNVGNFTLTAGTTLVSTNKIVLDVKNHLTLSNAINGSTGNPVDVWLNAGGYVRVTAGVNTYGGDIILRSNKDDVTNSNATYAAIDITGATLQSGGGDIVFGGGSASDGAGLPTDYAQSSVYSGLSIISSTLNAGGGNISIKGMTTTSAKSGVVLTTANILTSSAGDIILQGLNTTISTGLAFSLGDNTISTQNGDITLIGESLTNGTGIWTWADGTYKIFSESGNITLTGVTQTTGHDFLFNGTTFIGTNNAGTTTSGNVLLTAAGVGGVTFGTSVQIATSGAGNIAVNAGAGAFVNSRGSDVFSVEDGRWLVYSGDPSADTRGGLVHDFKQYNASYGDAILGSGNGFVYALAPSLSVTLTGVVGKIYDGTTAATLSSANFNVAGEIDGDAVTLTGASTYDTRNIGTGKTVTANLSVVGVQDAYGAVYGYGFTTPTITGAVGTITPAGLVLTANNAARFMRRSNPAFSASYQGLQTGDTASVVQGLIFTTLADEFSATGDYAITPSNASAANYTITYQDGTLTIMTLPATYIAQSQTIVPVQIFVPASTPVLEVAAEPEPFISASAPVMAVTVAGEEPQSLTPPQATMTPEEREEQEEARLQRRARNPFHALSRQVWIEMDDELKRQLGYR